jgi:S1-C subfamily serine protease
MGWKSGSRSLLRLIGACLALVAISAQPVRAADSDWDYEWVWYTPRPSTDVNEAAKVLTNLQPFFSNYGGMMIDRMVITRSGLAIHASQTTVQQQSQYVPSYGGSWVGNTYVPYYGGSTVTRQVPVTSEAQSFVSYPDLDRIQILRFPKLRFGWGVHFLHRDASKNVTLRTSDEGLARQFADAAFTLASSANPNLIADLDFLGLGGNWDDAKAAKKARWAGVKGFYLTGLATGGPGAKAGLQVGDILFESNGKPLSSESRFYSHSDDNVLNDLELVFDLKVFRNKQEMPVRLVTANVPLRHWLALKPPRLGVNQRDPSAEELARQGFATAKGSIVRAVFPNTLAQRMDFRVGDWVLELNGQAIASSKALSDFVAANPVTSAKVLRDGAEVELKAPASATPAAPQPKLGLNVREVPDGAGTGSRLEVVSIEPGSIASRMDFRAGDFVVEVNGKPVARTSDLAAVVAAGPVTAAKVERAGKVVALAEIASF